jgi:hypothetical protein
MMMLTIELPPDTQAKLEKRATETGQDMQTYVLTLIRRDVGAPPLRELFAPVREQIQASGVTDEELEGELETAVSDVRLKRRA